MRKRRKDQKLQDWSWWRTELARLCARSECPRQFEEPCAMRLYESGLSIVEALEMMPMKTWAESMAKGGRAAAILALGKEKP
jgi:hypothetical protein